MASNGDSVHDVNSAVRYDNSQSDAVQVELQSPAKNRAKGRTMGQPGGRRRTLVLFERASKGSWWNPKFDSDRLEREVLHYYFPYNRRRFQYALVYIILASLAWAAFFGGMRLTSRWFAFMTGSLVLGFITAAILLFTRSAVYERLVIHTSLLLSFLLCGLLLASFAFKESDISLVGTFAGSMEILLLFYTFIPMPLYVCAPLAILYSVAYECLVVYRYEPMSDAEFVLSKVLLHLSLHLLGIHIFIVTQVRYRSNFWKVVQCVMARRDLAAEKLNLENMIHSLMPKSVADQVMTSRTDKDKDEAEQMGDGRKKRSKSKRVKGEIIFRSFNMNQMENVSILFADIVGFTKMSSNKTAEHLVGLLNDLFGRFDKLCTEAKCEKISTLGDCYYCVAGCPEPQPDHAECCVKMGLGMIKAIKEFDEDNNESVNMRVGVHTGTVLCGIVGTRRFKFDVWSNDVTLANIMESSGRPGMVHISEASYELLKDKYEVEEGEEVEDLRSFDRLIEHYDLTQSSFTIRHEQEERVIRTYFITGIKPGAFGADGPTSNSVIISLATPETSQAMSGETIEDSSVSAINHTETESSLNGMSKDTLLSGKSRNSFVEVTENDKLDDKVPTGEEGRGASSQLASPVHVHEVTHTPVPVPSVAISVPVSTIFTNTNNTHLTSTVTPAPPHAEVSSQNSVPQAKVVQAFKNPTPAKQHFKGKVVAISMIKRSDDQTDSTTVPFSQDWSKDKFHRDQMDQEMIDHLNKDTDLMEFSSNLPINSLTLFFTRFRLERDYRNHYFDSQEESIVASPRCQSFIEMVLSLMLFLLIAVCCFVLFDISLAFLVMFFVSLLLEVLVLLGIWSDIKWGCLKKIWFKEYEDDHPRNTAWWKVHNFVGIVMASLPAVTVYANLSCEVVWNNGWQDLFFCFCLFVSLLCFCNFSMGCSMVKSFVASLVGLALVILLNVSLCDLSGLGPVSTSPAPVTLNATATSPASVLTAALWANTTPAAPLTLLPSRLFSGENQLRFEFILDVLLILLLIWFLNREFEISYRLSFHGSAQADKDTRTMQENKEQADWLLHNIIPVHVSDVVKRTHKYSKNHKDVGVIFATIINFNEFYDESFKGGREYLRVLNELVSDYEELLDRKCFKDVEKIKTISSSFMAASGLNEVSRSANRHPNAHLFALMDFAVELQNAVNRFNESILNFNFVLNIGYNFGEVTAGVIGTTKLLYDIWGDTVNIASRMYSTGAPDRIQVPESTLPKLSEMFKFEYRGEIFVKGKGNMKTYLYTGKRPNAHWE